MLKGNRQHARFTLLCKTLHDESENGKGPDNPPCVQRGKKKRRRDGRNSTAMVRGEKGEETGRGWEWRSQEERQAEKEG